MPIGVLTTCSARVDWTIWKAYVISSLELQQWSDRGDLLRNLPSDTNDRCQGLIKLYIAFAMPEAMEDDGSKFGARQSSLFDELRQNTLMDHFTRYQTKGYCFHDIKTFIPSLSSHALENFRHHVGQTACNLSQQISTHEEVSKA